MDIILNKKIKKLETFSNNKASNSISDTFTLDLSSSANFTIETLDTNAKTIAFTNIPATGVISVTVKLKYTNAVAITHPNGTLWKDGTVPTFTAGKQYLLLYVSYDNGITWLASSLGAW